MYKILKQAFFQSEEDLFFLFYFQDSSHQWLVMLLKYILVKVPVPRPFLGFRQIFISMDKCPPDLIINEYNTETKYVVKE